MNHQFIVRTTEKKQLLKKKNELEESINDIDIESLEKCNFLLQKMSEKQREKACIKLQELCTYALQYSLSDNYESIIEITKYRNKPAVNLYIKKVGSDMKTSPEDSNGGGIVDIISMALRFVTMQILEPQIDGPIILDEPYKMVSEEHIPMISNFIKNLSIDFGRQVILCTHNKFLSQVADKQIFVTMGENNNSIVGEE